jgi:hypothetical protein
MFECKTFKNLMLSADEVYPYLVGTVVAGAQQSNFMDGSNHITQMINHAPESDLGPCPESDYEGGDDLDLTAESDCVRIISGYDPLGDATWNRRKHGNFAFVDQDAYDDPPTMTDTPRSLRKGREKSFRAPIVAFMSTLPLLFWKICVGQSNKFAHQEMDKAKEKGKPENVICGTKWRHDITLCKFMVFMGILLYMCIFPLPDHSYVLHWLYGAVSYPFVNKMQLRRFQQIRSVLHFNDNNTLGETNDALHKVMPLLNIVKVTLRAFTQVGSEVALDKASVASCSSYGRMVIFFNPMKNCGKFHFRFYLLRCATTFDCVRMKVNTKNNNDKPDADQPMGTLNNTTRMSKLNKLVMEMLKPLFGLRGTVNMDNVYTLPGVLILLKNQKLYSRGTVLNNSRMAPQCIVWMKKEAEDAVRGSLRWAVNTLIGIFAFGWTNGCPVHMLYMTDGSHQQTTVPHQVGMDKNDVPAPNTVKAYNAYMQ